MVDIMTHTIDGKLISIIINPTDEQREYFGGCCDDREMYRTLTDSIQFMSGEMVLLIANAIKQCQNTSWDNNVYMIPKDDEDDE